MPSTIKNYALDYNNDALIDLKSTEDSFASAANYINRIGWKKSQPCFIRVKLTNNINGAAQYRVETYDSHIFTLGDIGTLTANDGTVYDVSVLGVAGVVGVISRKLDWGIGAAIFIPYMYV